MMPIAVRCVALAVLLRGPAGIWQRPSVFVLYDFCMTIAGLMERNVRDDKSTKTQRLKTTMQLKPLIFLDKIAIWLAIKGWW